MSDPAGSRSSATTNAILDHFGSLMRHVSGWHAPDFLGVDVTMSQAKCLYIAAVSPGIGMSAMARQLQVSLSALSGLVDRLVDHGYLDRREDPSDRRQQQVTLTPEGKAVVERIRELNTEHMRSLLRGLSVAELQSLRIGIAALDRQSRTIDQLTPPHRQPDPERTTA